VSFTESWGHHLERRLGPAVPVLNFGVDGYGLDQTYLRYQRDVRGWKPRVVLISLMGHELLRTMAVYPFVSFRWPPCVVKPRFTLDRRPAGAAALRRLRPGVGPTGRDHGRQNSLAGAVGDSRT
jgi:hypothetical protein